MTDQADPPDLDVSIPLPKGLKVTGEEPYRILLVTDFAGLEHGSLSGPLRDQVVEVNAETFNQVMADARPAVSYTAGDPVAPGDVMVEVNLRFDSMRAFTPDELLEQIPAAKALMNVRERIADRMLGKLSADELGTVISRAAASDEALNWLIESTKFSPGKPAGTDAAVEGLLDQIDLGAESADQPAGKPKSPLSSLVSAAAGGGASIPTEEASALRRTLAEIDRRISLWLTAVLKSPAVQQLESAWRGLALLVSRMEFRKGLRLSILHAPQNALVERFTAKVIDPVFDEGAEAPHLIAVNAEFANTAADLEALDGLAQHAASLPAVAVAGAAPAFFGVKHAWQIPTLPTLVNVFDQWQFAKWKSLRTQPYAKHLGVVFGRCLLRAPYQPEDGQGLDFVYREKCVTDKDFVWASGSLAAACTVAQSVAETGWPVGVSGPLRGRVEGLPIAHGGKKGEKQFGPTDTQTPDAKVEEMGMSGINAVTPLRHTDDLVFWNGMTAARPQRPDPAAIFEVSLPYMLFAGRLSALLWDLKPHLAGLTAEQVAVSVTTHVAAWLQVTGEEVSECVAVQVAPAEEDPAARRLAVTVTPPQALIPGGVPVVLGYKLPSG